MLRLFSERYFIMHIKSRFHVVALLLTLLSFSFAPSAPLRAEITQVSVTGPSLRPADPLPWPVSASLSEATDRYPHNVLGRIPAFTKMEVTLQTCRDCATPQMRASVTLPPPWVFEDIAPRLWDVTGDGRAEIVVVQSHETQGARLTVWALRAPSDTTGPVMRMIAATPPIGTRFRWLAPFGYGDFTGDGRIEIAYVETPHLGKTLRLVGIEGAELVPRGALRGVTNHRIGQETISGFVRHCAGRAQAVLATADWSRLTAVGFANGQLAGQDLGPLTSAQDWTRAQACDG